MLYDRPVIEGHTCPLQEGSYLEGGLTPRRPHHVGLLLVEAHPRRPAGLRRAALDHDLARAYHPQADCGRTGGATMFDERAGRDQQSRLPPRAADRMPQPGVGRSTAAQAAGVAGRHRGPAGPDRESHAACQRSATRRRIGIGINQHATMDRHLNLERTNRCRSADRTSTPSGYPAGSDYLKVRYRALTGARAVVHAGYVHARALAPVLFDDHADTARQWSSATGAAVAGGTKEGGQQAHRIALSATWGRRSTAGPPLPTQPTPVQQRQAPSDPLAF